LLHVFPDGCHDIFAKNRASIPGIGDQAQVFFLFNYLE
jgi:hypothetical protein